MGIHTPVFFGVAVAVPLLLTIVIISSSVEARLLSIVAALLGVIGAVFRFDHSSPVTVWMGHLAVTAAILAVSLVIAKAVFAPGRVTHQRLEGAVILYLNIAVMFTSIYRLIFELDPAAFLAIPPHQTEYAAMASMLYFSFTTLTATGFGEILPVNPLARSMANLESIAGQLYLAILLARLVTMHTERRQN